MGEPTLYLLDEEGLCSCQHCNYFRSLLVPVEPLTTFMVEQHDEDFGTIIPESDIIRGITMLHPSGTIRYAIVELGAGIGDADG